MEKLKNLRKERGLTQEQVSENLGITYQAYAHYENGRRKPDPEMLIKLSDFFNITVDKLIGHAPKERSQQENTEEQYILQLFNLLNSSRKKMLIGIPKSIPRLPTVIEIKRSHIKSLIKKFFNYQSADNNMYGRNNT